MDKLLKEEQEKIKQFTTKEEFTEFWKGRSVMVLKGDWKNERCEFIEMIGGEKRESWRAKVKTRFGTFLELSGNDFMIIMQQIMSTASEAEKIKRNFDKQGFKDISNE